MRSRVGSRRLRREAPRGREEEEKREDEEEEEKEEGEEVEGLELSLAEQYDTPEPQYTETKSSILRYLLHYTGLLPAL